MTSWDETGLSFGHRIKDNTKLVAVNCAAIKYIKMVNMSKGSFGCIKGKIYLYQQQQPKLGNLSNLLVIVEKNAPTLLPFSANQQLVV